MILPKKRKRDRMGLKAPAVIRAPGFLRFLRQHECAVTFNDAHEGPTEAAHVRIGTDGGVGMKPSDCYALPLCSGHHRRQHQIGEKAFEKEAGIDMRAIADAMWGMWLKTDAGRRYRMANE